MDTPPTRLPAAPMRAALTALQCVVSFALVWAMIAAAFVL